MKNNNLIKNPDEYDFREIASLGKSFLKAAKKCNESNIEHVGWSHSLIVPIVTNMTFACELFLKAILKQDGKQIKTHSLVNLFDELQDEVKKEIRGTEKEEIFMNNLTIISNLFEKWRYVYERSDISFDFVFLSKFAEKLLLIVENME